MGQSDLQEYAVIKKIVLVFFIFWFEKVPEDEYLFFILFIHCFERVAQLASKLFYLVALYK